MHGAAFLLFLLIQFIAGFIVGATSFGGNLFAVPLLTMMMSPRDAILIGCLTFWALIMMVAALYWRHLLWRDILVLSVAGVLGAPLGAWLLAHASVRFLLLAAGFAIVLFLAWQFIMPRIGAAERRVPAWLAWPCGILAGVMSGTVAMGGPPVAFYAYMRRWSKENTIGSLSAAFAPQIAAIIAMQWAQGLYTPEIVRLSLWGSLVSCLGVAASLPLVKRINVRVFRGMVLIMLGLSAAVLLIKGLLS